MSVQGVSVAFGSTALTASPTYTRLDSPNYPSLSLQSWTVDRGRSSEFDNSGTGTATAVFIDRGGILDPGNPNSPFYNQFNPSAPAAIGLQNPVTETWTTVFTGFVSEYLYDYDPAGGQYTVTVEMNDAFNLFSRLEMSPGHHGATPPERFNGDQIYFAGQPTSEKHVDNRQVDLLDAAGWPGTGLTSSTLRDIFSGNVEVQEKTYERLDQLLAALQDAADAEGPGLNNIYMSKTGVYTFRGRFTRFFPTHPAYGITDWKAGDTATCTSDGTYAPFATLAARRSENDLINAAYAAPLGVDSTDVPGNFVTDSTSINNRGWHNVSYPDLLTFSGHDDLGATVDGVTETKKFATNLVDNYSASRTRVNGLGFQSTAPTAPWASNLWALMCGVEITDRILLQTAPPWAPDDGFSEYLFVDGIHYSADYTGGANFTNVTLDLDLTPQAYYSTNPFGTVDDGG